MMKLEDQIVPDRQLGAAYQDTRIDHEIKLNVNCNPSPARLTGIMITLGKIYIYTCIYPFNSFNIFSSITFKIDWISIYFIYLTKKYKMFQVRQIIKLPIL